MLRRVVVLGGRVAVLYGASSPQGTHVRARVLEPVAQSVRDNGFERVEIVDGIGGRGVVAVAPTADVDDVGRMRAR